jgi:hypothetical protein
VASIYQFGMHSYQCFGDNPPSESNPVSNLLCGASDETDAACSWHYPNTMFNNGALNSDNVLGCDGRYPLRWTAIRKISVLLERVDKVPGLDPDYIKQVKAEAKFVRALNYFEMFKRYGGVPIISKRIQLNDNFNIPRRSLKSVLDFILKDCDEAAPDLPDVQPANFDGRATKGMVLALKSRTLLYAASPRFNTATPYLDFGGYDSLICFGNYDVNRWQLASDAAKAVLDWAPGAGIYLITDQGPAKNYEYAWGTHNNPEIIWSNHNHGDHIEEWLSWAFIWPGSNMYDPYGGALIDGQNVTFTFVKYYEKKDGTPQTWDPNGGKDLQAKMSELDPRFAQTIAYNMSYYSVDFPQIQTYQGGANANPSVTGFWTRKFWPPSYNWANKGSWIPNEAMYSLNEQYLNYAEALNEVQGPVPAAYAAVNAIRERSGMPDLPGGLSQDQFRDRVRHERAIELAIEDHRLWDIMRWMIAENDKVMQGGMEGLKIYQIPNSAEFQYVPYVFETRVWKRRMYLFPFPTDEKNKGMIQNPGY